MAQGFIAAGNIPPMRFVIASSTSNRAVVLATSNSLVIGVSGSDTHNLPGTVGGVAIDDGYHAISGLPCLVYLPEDTDKGQPIYIELGGTVAWGDLLEASTNGVAVTSSSAGHFYGARALTSGVSGQFIKVQVITGTR